MDTVLCRHLTLPAQSRGDLAVAGELDHRSVVFCTWAVLVLRR